MSGAVRTALRRLLARRGRTLLAGLGIAAAAAMIGTAATLGFGLATGFERAADRADLPDAIARFDDEELGEIDERVRALPNVEERAYRLEVKGVPLAAGGRSSERGAVHVVRSGRRGYAIVDGADLSGRAGEVVVERGLAEEWDLRVGSELEIGRGARLRVAGIAISPDNVAFPLASAPRVYVAYEALRPLLGPDVDPVNVALVWAADPARLDITLAQARATGFGIDNLRFVTRDGVRLLLAQAAGIVIALLVAFSLVALGSALVMLAATARADVERRLRSIGVMRALGFSRAGVSAEHALEAVLLAAPAAALGLAVGVALAAAPSARLLESLNELPPGWSLAPILIACFVGIVAVVALATAWPAWRAAGRAPAEVLRGAAPRPPGGSRAPRLRGGPLALGARLASARPGRLAATVAVLAASISVVVLMLALASLLERLQADPGVLGKRYQLTAKLPASSADAVRALPGVEDASPRYVVEAADSFRLAESFRLIAYPDDLREWERPPLDEGRLPRGEGEVAIGAGLATALGARPGATLAALLPSGAEVRFRVAGVVRALENDGRVAFAKPGPLLAADPSIEPAIAVRLAGGADRAAVARGLERLGAVAEPVGAATSSNARFLGVLASLLRVVAAVNGLVCLYALVQALTLLALERRAVLAVLRAGGADRTQVALVLGGAAALVVALATGAGIVAERALLGPVVTRFAADYAALSLTPGLGSLLIVVLGTGTLALAATAWVAGRLAREPIVAGLRDE